MLELIVSDMDGTLLDGTMHIHPRNREAIMHTYQLGIPFIVATGRNFHEAKVLLDEAGIRCPIIGLNGAILFDREGEVEYEIDLDDQVAKEIIHYGLEHGYYMEAMTSKNVYSNSKHQRLHYIADMIQRMSPELSFEETLSRASQSNEVNSIEYIDDLTALIEEEGQHILKLVFIHEKGPQVLHPIQQELSQRYDNIYITSSFKSNLEISAKTANKGGAVAKYCQAHGYNPKNIMAIGDNLNDLKMLEMAGYSFAMANADPAVKEIADYVTGSHNEGGVADAIYKSLDLSQTNTQWEKAPYGD
ncbi:MULTISPECIES: Cof-type HAD-IIB family hydrolase [Aerococcus]|uniref:Cof-type HAD-IIB family hydrolase n=2 Tax=Aerococcus TaxID=1375 RepID=A0A178HFE2_9LACT|nr:MULTISPECIES: Cof-type HAD-IIB family hydrolase [Aerococcus]KAA9219087.1 Cof-type HAD-IIB family hydrolase [Aerococcus loyolae]KAA9265092.1 Cof-type HAD-IIB family hydrolase [Aerococcus loyolae]MCY3026139.1 Cof-type HAD-IIB family hydrolase [Aerococcus loyolae]MCY3027611.1 Cof-type HAD-IIB family hydrolase [Aerococcus loyolae]MCY3029482.1 Cof-type HAD-IIB family hydrolase [Aerococcus loyolae]